MKNRKIFHYFHLKKLCYKSLKKPIFFYFVLKIKI